MASSLLIVIEKVTVAVWGVGVPESVTVTTTLNGPAAVGVPLITPVDALIVRLAGRPAAENVNGGVPPVHVIVKL